jgi:nicotinamidase-related amidase
MSDLPPVTPKTSALLVMDYQPGILGRVEDAGALVARAADAIATVRRAGGHVGYVRVAFTDDDIASFSPRNKMAAHIAAAGAAMKTDAPETQVDARIAPQTGDIVVRKSRVGAFSTTDLAAQLRERGVTTLILAGVSTSGVVLSTVRDAADNDYRLLVLADACADFDAEVHRVLLERVFPRQADVIEVTDLAAVLSG